MKNARVFTLILLTASLVACDGKQDTVTTSEETYYAEEKVPTLTVIVNDVSRSVSFLETPPEEIREVLLDDARKGGTLLAGLCVLADSYEQTPYQTDCLRLTWLLEEGNVYKRSAAEEANKLEMARADSVCSSWMEQLKEQVFLPKEQDFSDVHGALQKAAQLVRSYNQKGYQVRLLVFSDLVQDTEVRSRLGAVELPEETEVIVIGVAPDFDMEAVFPGIDVIDLPVFRADLFTNSIPTS